MGFFHSPTFGKFFVYCSECYSGDCLDYHAGNQEIDYFHQFKDNFGNAYKQQKQTGYYFKGNVYSENPKEFKEEVLKELKTMTKDHIEGDIEYSKILLSFAEKTGNPYNYILGIDDFDTVLKLWIACKKKMSENLF